MKAIVRYENAAAVGKLFNDRNPYPIMPLLLTVSRYVDSRTTSSGSVV